MKKILVLLFAMLILSPLAAVDFLNLPGNFHLSITPILALTNGQIGEYVYTKVTDTTDKKISELQWDDIIIRSYEPLLHIIRKETIKCVFRFNLVLFIR